MRTLKLYPQLPYLAVERAMPDAIDRDPACARCELSVGVRSPCLPADGTPGGLLVVGEGPAAEDDRKGAPFISPTGAWVRQQIAAQWKGPVAFDNAIRCFPGARPVKEKSIDACRPFLADVLQEVKPTRVLAFGGDALRSVVGRAFHALSTRRGYAMMPSMNVPVFMLMPPGMALKNRHLRSWLEEDIAWALTADVKPPPLDGVVRYVETPEEAAEACFELEMAGFTYDTETFGMVHDPEFKIVTLACTPAGTDDAWVWDEKALKRPEMVKDLVRLFSDPRVRKGGQNQKYDALAVRAQLNVKVVGVDHDVRLMRKILEADAYTGLELMQPRVGMGGGKDEAGEHLDRSVANIRAVIFNESNALTPTGKPRKKKEVVPFDLDPTIERIMLERVKGGVEPETYAYAFLPEHVRGVYCARDAVSTEKLKHVYRTELEARPDQLAVWENITLPLQHAITEMEWNGIKVSIPALRKLQMEMAQREASLRAQIAPYVWNGFNPSSSAHDTGKLLFNAPTDDPPGLGLKPTRITPSGKAGTAAGDIEDIDHPVVPLIMEVRKVMHFRSQYADGMASYIRADGRIHPSIKIDGTETGRPSCERPNMLNIPRAGSADGKMCRDLFVADPGNKIVEFDYNQIELRVAAMLSEDDVMIGMFKSGMDFHLATAKMVAPYFGLKADDIDKEHPLRSRSKTINFGVLYGKDAYGIAMELGISKKEAQLVVDAILGKFRKLDTWIKKRVAEGRKTGGTNTYWNGKPARWRPLWKIGGFNEDERLTAERSTYNTAIQGTATDYTNASLGAIQRYIEDDEVPAKLVLTVYDSIIAEVREDVVPEYAYTVNRIMTSWPSGDMPIKADCKIGDAWGSLSDYKVT